MPQEQNSEMLSNAELDFICADMRCVQDRIDGRAPAQAKLIAEMPSFKEDLAKGFRLLRMHRNVVDTFRISGVPLAECDCVYLDAIEAELWALFFSMAARLAAEDERASASLQ